MQKYLSDPARIVYACWDPAAVERRDDGVFRMRFKEKFLSISIDMYVDVKFEVGDEGEILCRSVAFSVDDMTRFLGQEFAQTFYLKLAGELRAKETETKVRALTLKDTLLTGDVGVSIGGKV